MMFIEVFATLFFVWFIWYFITTYMERKNMPPGPFPYPFFGNIPQIMLADPVKPFSKLAEKYGDIFTVTFPNGNSVILNTASLVREARLSPQSQGVLVGKTAKSFYPILDIMGRNMGGADYSTVYRFERKVFVSAMHIFGAGVEEASVRAGHGVLAATKVIDRDPQKPFSPKNLFQSSIIAQFWEWLTSKKIELDDPIVTDINEFNAIITRQGLLNTVYQLFPFICYIPTKFTREIKHAQQIRKNIFPPEYRSQRESYIPGTVRNLTDSFISAYEKEVAKDAWKGMDDGGIPGLMVNVVGVGSGTSSTWLTWLFLYNVLYPDVQRKIHEELDAAVGRERMPKWQDADNLPYLQATLCEVERASGMVTLIGTNAISDTTIAGYHIPKGTFVALNLPKVHDDEREWSEPEKFKPERFLDENGKFVGWNKRAFMPFGIGRRDCPGQSLARVTLFSFASILLHRYKIELPEGAKMPSDKVSSPQFIADPDDFQVVAKPRELKLSED